MRTIFSKNNLPACDGAGEETRYPETLKCVGRCWQLVLEVCGSHLDHSGGPVVYTHEVHRSEGGGRVKAEA